jgi:hypothetical protein
MMMHSTVLLSFIALFSFVNAAELYTNPLVENADAPDPGAIFVNGTYYVATTSGDSPNIYPIRSSSK